MKLLAVLGFVMVCGVAVAGAPTLAPFKGSTATVSFPKGWIVQQENGVFAAQQDPAKKDAAAILVMYVPNTTNATEEQLLEGIVAQVSNDLKIVERAPVKGGTGHYIIGDGTSEGIKVRVAAIAAVVNGQAIVSLFAAKPADFKALGGLTLAATVLATLQPTAPSAAATTPPPPVVAQPAAPAAKGKLAIGTPPRLTVADLAGDWANDDGIVTSYSSGATSSGGYSAAATAEKWRIDRKGVIYTKLTATTASSTRMTYQVNENSAGAIAISADGILSITRKKGEGSSASYFIRGWGATADLGVLQLNGPYYGEAIDVARLRADPRYASNMNSYWVRATR